MALACSACLAAAAPAGAQPSSAPTAPASSVAKLDWQATPACSGRAQVLAEISRILGEGTGPRREVKAQASLEKQTGDAWRVVLVMQVDGGARTRAFDAESCQAAVQAVALMLAVAIDPLAAAGVGPTTPEAPGVPPPPLPPPPPPWELPEEEPAELPPGTEASPRSAEPLRLQWTGIVAASVSSELGTEPGGGGSLPSPAAGIEAASGVQAWRIRLEVGGTYWFSQSAQLPGSPTGSDFRLVSGEGRLIYFWSLGRFSVGPVASAGFGWIHQQGFGGSTRNYTKDAQWPAIGGGALLVFHPVEHLGLRLLTGGSVPLDELSYTVCTANCPMPGNPPPKCPPQHPCLPEYQTLYQASEVVVRVLLGAELEIP